MTPEETAAYIADAGQTRRGSRKWQLYYDRALECLTEDGYDADANSSGSYALAIAQKRIEHLEASRTELRESLRALSLRHERCERALSGIAEATGRSVDEFMDGEGGR